MTQSRCWTAALAVVGVISAGLVGLAGPASAANPPCTEGLNNPTSKRYRSTWTFWQNQLSFPPGMPANLGAAMDAGAASLNIVRNDCTRNQFIDPQWRTQFVQVGSNTMSPDAVDGHNTIGWEHFRHPPANEVAECRSFKMTNYQALASTCAMYQLSRPNDVFEFGMVFNAYYGPAYWSTDLGNKTKYVIQAVATHEFGHAIGMGHIPASVPPNYADGGARLTMYPSYMPQDPAGQYTLGKGDMLSYRAVKP